MAKQLVFILIACCFVSWQTIGQIKLPAGFKCESPDAKGDKVFWGFIGYSDCKKTFQVHDWGKEHIACDQITEKIITRYGSKISFIPNQLGTYVGQSKADLNYRYIIVIPSLSIEVQFYSPCRDSNYETLSSWMLSEVISALKEGRKLYFTTFDGNSCY